MAAFGHAEHEIKPEGVISAINKRRDLSKNLSDRPRLTADSQIRNACHAIERGEPAAEIARARGISKET